jgi:hypothetical protein
MYMANRRSAGKRLIGAQASPELWKGVDAWLEKHPRETVSSFVLTSCLEKLKKDGIPVDWTEVMKDRRARVPVKYPRPSNGPQSNEN